MLASNCVECCPERFQMQVATSNQQCEQILVAHLSRDMVKVAALILDENSKVSEQWGHDMWTALETMQKSLRKAGFKRPVRQPKPQPTSQQQVGLDLD